MRAATIRDKQIVIEEHPDPKPGDGEVLVKVHAAGLNGADMHQLAGGYPAPPGSPQDIPGLEFAGLRSGRSKHCHVARLTTHRENCQQSVQPAVVYPSANIDRVTLRPHTRRSDT